MNEAVVWHGSREDSAKEGIEPYAKEPQARPPKGARIKTTSLTGLKGV